MGKGYQPDWTISVVRAGCPCNGRVPVPHSSCRGNQGYFEYPISGKVIYQPLTKWLFYLYNLTQDNGVWIKQNRLEHVEWHYNIRNMQVPYYIYEKYANFNKVNDSFEDIG